jgi:hypothetical protein
LCDITEFIHKSGNGIPLLSRLWGVNGLLFDVDFVSLWLIQAILVLNCGLLKFLFGIQIFRARFIGKESEAKSCFRTARGFLSSVDSSRDVCNEKVDIMRNSISTGSTFSENSLNLADQGYGQ